MSTDFSGKERAFVDSLASETGRDLAQWMTAISEQGPAHRNDIIDWLRQQGFTFARASWLERIFHNGGKLIYGDEVQTAPFQKKPAPLAPRSGAAPVPSAPDAADPLPRPRPRPASDQDIETLLLAAKAFRPLAQALLREILGLVPGADATAARGLIVLSHRAPFAAITPGTKDVKLYLALCPAEPAVAGWQKARLPAGLDSLSALTHMLIVTDARQLSDALRQCVKTSARLTER